MHATSKNILQIVLWEKKNIITKYWLLRIESSTLDLIYSIPLRLHSTLYIYFFGTTKQRFLNWNCSRKQCDDLGQLSRSTWRLLMPSVHNWVLEAWKPHTIQIWVWFEHLEICVSWWQVTSWLDVILTVVFESYSAMWAHEFHFS